MTDTPLYHSDPYAREASGEVVGHTDEGGVVVSPALFYPTGGGQPGDSGTLRWQSGTMPVATAVKGPDGLSVLVAAEPCALPSVGTQVHQEIDWERRHKHMRVHTALHLLSVVVPLPVTGGAIAAGKGRLDFLMPEPPEDRAGLEAALQDLVEQDLPVSETWVTDEVLDAMPELVKTMTVQPPRGTGRVRLVRIGQGADQLDLQPCGGTHVARTSEIGQITLGKIENKGKQNRRVNIVLA